ncbi:hypothetical protein GCM10020229_45730 [Kitasatospora albolonga]|uniref:hypothetical protein n=1 Tax=Kitasatospora albolonga TaxID=68173 RepID=UPI0031EF7EFA
MSAEQGSAQALCPSCTYFDQLAQQYPAATNPTIARKIDGWRATHKRTEWCPTRPEMDADAA